MDNERIIRLEEDNKNIFKRLDILENKVEDIFENTISIKEMTIEIKQMREDIKKYENRIELLESKPQKRWDNMVNQIISLIVAGVVGFILSKISI